MTSTFTAALPPSPENFLAALDGLVAVRRVRAQIDAMEAALFAACASYADGQLAKVTSKLARDREIPWRSTAMELGAALHISDRTATAHMEDAALLVTRFQPTMQALTSGEITRAHAKVIVDAGFQITDDEQRASYQERVLPIAAEETPARTRSIARVVASHVDREVIAKRQEAALCTRSVRVTDLDDGMALLTALLPAVLAHGIHDRLTQTARLVKDAEHSATQSTLRDARNTELDPAPDLAAGDSTERYAGTSSHSGNGDAAEACEELTNSASGRTDATDAGASRTPARRINEIRADLLADLLLTGAPSDQQVPVISRDGIDLTGIQGHIQIVVTADALLGDSPELPILTGHGPVSIDQVRALAEKQPSWDRLTIDPRQNSLLTVDTYRPTAAQRRFLNAFDEHCRQPGCRRLAMRCDVDHSHDAAKGGETSLGNLGDLCRAHHAVKHADGWTLERKPDGIMLWRSKHGRVYPDAPRPSVAFMLSPDSPGNDLVDAPF